VVDASVVAVTFGVGAVDVGPNALTGWSDGAGQATATNETGSVAESGAVTDPGSVAESAAITVFTTSERKENGNRANFIAAVRADGSRLYFDDSLRVYNDVDPVPGTNATVVYVGANRLNPDECDAMTACWLNVVERVNLTTGAVQRVYEHRTSIRHGQWHDVDRVNDTHLLVADIALDRVFLVNVSSGIYEWTWSAQEDLPLSSGGPFPRDWTHLNDVELLPDGRVMVSLRNQDRVVFVDRQTGMQEGWTLGAEDDYSILYEQHNPDFIPEAMGGPAVLVADSENDRVVEFHRTEVSDGERAGEWREVWSWSDDRLDWPRDADRLPNGHTLITDTDGGRIVEIDADGTVVWSIEVEGAYDAERLGTGDESAGGPAVNASR
jgi:hypothetical protein